MGRPLNNGEVLKTFPNIADQLEFVWQGDVGTGIGKVYGDPNRAGGPHIAGSFNGNQMPAWNGNLTQAQLLDVVRHERETISGQVVPAKQIAADGTLLWPNGTPGARPHHRAVEQPRRHPMLDPTTGKLTNPALVEFGQGQRLTDVATRAGAARVGQLDRVQPRWLPPQTGPDAYDRCVGHGGWAVGCDGEPARSSGLVRRAP